MLKHLIMPSIFLCPMQMIDSPEEVGKRLPSRNSPRFVCFSDDDAEPTYFVYIEQTILCQVSTFVKALLIWFVSHYIFNLEYTKSAKDAAVFIQENVFLLPQAGAKTSTYLSFSSDMTFVRK